MVKIERNPIPPSSLAIEAQKVNGVYNGEDVVQQLKTDFHDKCYICELKNLSDPEVEHLRSHYNRKRKELVFDWNNLFYSCRHCNLIKMEKKYEDKILDCCVMDPETVLEHIFVNGHVEIHNKTEQEEVKMTADLIQNCFELKNTGIRIAACQHRIEELSNTMGVFYKVLKKYKDFPNKERYQKSLHEMLSRSSAFAVFKRSYVRMHLEDYPNLREYVS